MDHYKFSARTVRNICSVSKPEWPVVECFLSPWTDLGLVVTAVLLRWQNVLRTRSAVWPLHKYSTLPFFSLFLRLSVAGYKLYSNLSDVVDYDEPHVLRSKNVELTTTRENCTGRRFTICAPRHRFPGFPTQE